MDADSVPTDFAISVLLLVALLTLPQRLEGAVAEKDTRYLGQASQVCLIRLESMFVDHSRGFRDCAGRQKQDL